MKSGAERSSSEPPPSAGERQEGGGFSPDQDETKAIAFSDLAAIVGLFGLTFLLFLVLERMALYGGVVGVLSAMAGLFSPAPAVHVFLRWGSRVGTIGLVVVALVLGWVGGWSTALEFMVSIGIIAWVLSTAILARRPVEVAVGWCLVGAAAGIGMLYVMDAMGINPESVAPLLRPEVDEGVQQLPGAVNGLNREEFGQLVRIIGRLMPAVAVVQAALISLLNYTLIRYFWTSRGAGVLFPARDLALWSMPETAVWALIGAGVLAFFLGEGVLFWVMSNVLLVLAFGYFLQGLAIFHFLSRKYGIAVFVRIPLYFFAVTFSYAVAAFGLFDLWFDFRKIRAAGSSSDQSDGGGDGLEEEDLP
jgi:hypothetical protein